MWNKFESNVKSAWVNSSTFPSGKIPNRMDSYWNDCNSPYKGKCDHTARVYTSMFDRTAFLAMHWLSILVFMYSTCASLFLKWEMWIKCQEGAPVAALWCSNATVAMRTRSTWPKIVSLAFWHEWFLDVCFFQFLQTFIILYLKSKESLIKFHRLQNLISKVHTCNGFHHWSYIFTNRCMYRALICFHTTQAWDY